MYADRLRAYLLTLPHVVETMQWGANLVFWTGDKAIGGKMFALINLDEPHLASGHRPLVISYAVGHVRYPELLEVEGLVPAPYMARIHWVAADRWDVFSTAEWQRELRSAYDLTLAKLPKKVLATLALPTKIQKDLIARRRKILTAKAAKRQA